MPSDMDASKATALARKFLEENFGNISMLLYRIESVEPNSKATIYKVLASILPSVGASERVYYYLIIDIEKADVKEVFIGKEEIQEGKKVIVLTKKPLIDDKSEK